MKNIILPLIALSLISAQSFAASSKALDKKFKYCDDITQVDKLLDRTNQEVSRLQAEGVKIERIVVSKDRKELYLISGDVLVRAFEVAFGRNPEGHKQFEGDNKTPEGIYSIDYKNPKSEFNKSLHISYPNKQDIEYAKSQGKSPGGDIMIHGLPKGQRKGQLTGIVHPFNWTQGCVAVTNEQIEEVYALVKENTLVEICAMSK
ncbi:murein L,D-transpeptidase family protein [Bdellovibrio bacteriovorus]|uniref:L,D-transpeptidase family protein n=1 Tax=Bdellovibrio bacteriovorus TaxID=959 RepID=UPI0035A5B551